MRRTAPCLWLLVLSALAPAALWASTTSPPPVEVIRVVGDDNYPPYFFRANDGTLRGIVPDQWALWENKTGIQVNLVATNWGDALRLMQDQDADVLEAAFQAPERDRLYDFTPAYAQIPVPVFSHRSLGGIADVSSLRGFTIGVKEGDAVIETLAAHGIDSIQEYPNYEAIVQAAKNQELRVFSIDEPPAVYYLYKFGIEDQFRNSFVLYTGALHRAVHKGSAELLALVQEGFDHISPDEYRAIDEKWMGTPVAWRVVVRRFAWLLLTGIVAVLLLGGGNLILGRQVQRRTAELNRRLADLRASEDDLRNSRQYFATVFNTIHDALFILDAQTFEVLDINQRMIEMFGYTSRQDALAHFKRITGGGTTETKEETRQRLCKARDGEPQAFEWQATHRDGHLFWVEVNVVAQRIGAVDRLIITARNISDRKKAEAERLLVERRIQEAQRLESLGLLAGGIAHDFNNILTTILGNIDLALQDIPRDSTARADLATAITATYRAAALAQQMLAYSGKGHFVIETLDVVEEIQTTTRMLRSSLPPNAKLQTHVPTAPLLINADAAQFRQVLLNLVLNAAEALDQQPGTVQVTAGLVSSATLDTARLRPQASLAPGPYVMLEIADTGSGIQPDCLEKIFDPFFSTKFTGRGLGLAVVLGIMRGHRGALQVDSTPDQGTTFRAYFPARVEPDSAVLSSAPSEPAAEHVRSGFLLLVDDEADLRETASKLFSRLGYQVLCAASGPQAIQILRARADQIQGVILDLAMPHMDGVEPLTKLHDIRPDLPVILSSGYVEMDVIERFKGPKPDGFIQKPYTLDSLRQALDRIWPV